MRCGGPDGAVAIGMISGRRRGELSQPSAEGRFDVLSVRCRKLVFPGQGLPGPASQVVRVVNTTKFVEHPGALAGGGSWAQ